jgi:Zn-finger domain-containing protein
MDKISYFDTTSKLLQNLENCTDKEIDMDFIKESLKTLISIIKTQNEFLEYLIDLDEDMELVTNDSPIVIGMICYIRSKKRFGKIVEINDETNNYTLNILGTQEKLVVTRKHFNL